MDELQDMSDEELRAERRRVEAQIIPLERRASAITILLNMRSMEILRREADKCLREKPSYADFKRQLDSIGGNNVTSVS